MTEKFSKFGWTLPLKNKNAQTTNSFENILKTSEERKPNLIETDRGKELYNSIFQNNNIIKHYSRKSSLGAVFAERVNLTIRNLLYRPLFERSGSNWLDVLPMITKPYINRVHSSTKLTPIQASLKKNEGLVYQNFTNNRKGMEPKNKIHDLLRTAELKKTFSKSDTTNWSYELYEISEIVNDTIPSYRITDLPDRYNEALLKKTN